jgi:hypothetical protein
LTDEVEKLSTSNKQLTSSMEEGLKISKGLSSVNMAINNKNNLTFEQ